jgi:hypothetical protein
MCAEMKIERKIIIPCRRGDLFCKNSMVGDARVLGDDRVWCCKWRENHSKDRIIYGCDKNFGIP